MIVSPHHVQTLLFCPLKVYLEAGLGLKPKTEAAEVGRQAHVAYQYLTQALHERGRISEDDVEEALRLAPNLSREEVLKLAEFREKVGLAGRPVEVEVVVESAELGFRGKIDLLEGEAPVEVKYRGRVKPSDILQLSLYAVALEEMRGVNVEVGYVDLLLPRERVKVYIGRLKRLAPLIISAVRTASLKPYRPPKPPCRLCDLKIECTLFLGVENGF